MKVHPLKLSLPPFLLLVFSLTSLSDLSAQPTYWLNQKKSYNWMLCGGWNFVDDDGQGYKELLAIRNSWQMVPYPSYISVDRFTRKGWSWVATASYNQYNPKKLYNNEYGHFGYLVSADFAFKFSFYPWMRGILDPYFFGGAGATYRSVKSVAPIVPTIDGGLGLNFWIRKRLGIQVQSTAKLGVDLTNPVKSNTNYLQHSVGLVYKPQAGKPRNRFRKKQYKWTHTKQRYRFKGSDR